MLYLFRGPEGVLVREFLQQSPEGKFTLSWDGRKLAREVGPCRLFVSDLVDGRLRNLPLHGRYHSNPTVHLGTGCLRIAAERYIHEVRWSTGQLEFTHQHLGKPVKNSVRDAAVRAWTAATRLVPSGEDLYDPKRFVTGIKKKHLLVDVFGQVILCDPSGRPVCMLKTLNANLAAWLPDGTAPRPHLDDGRSPVAGRCGADRPGAAGLGTRRSHTVKAPFRLRKRLTAAPADGLLFPREDMAGLVALCAATATVRLPIVYRLAGGYLLALHAPTTGVFPGTIRLRRLGPNLFLPVDAELVPALLPDEATVLGRERGLVFLPGGRVLGFVPACPVPPRALLQAGRLERFRWEPFPSPPHLAARIDSVTLELPNDAPEVVLEAGGTDVGIEDPLADASEQPSRAADGVTLGLGRALMGLGRLLGLRGLSQVGARWVASVLNRVPRLGASLLGRQEAALRALLREFHEGNLERALRRAVPLGDENQRIKNRPLASGSLPNQAPHYSLADLLQGRRTGSGPLWLSSADVFAELQEAYRRAAAEATRRGDYRRAAFIYGKLLRNYRAAADVLAEGGLFHDAAIIYLKKVIDVPAAARAFERAGEIDEALELYRTRKDHLAAGDLLRRVGEAEAALAEFLLAADNLVSTQGHLAAGELLLEHVGYPDLARTYFERGWAQRPGGSSIGSLFAWSAFTPTWPNRPL